MDQVQQLAQWWDEANTEGVWWAPWRAAVEGLTAQQAAWKPAPDRHSIWELVNHMTHWRDYFAHRAEGGSPADERELEDLNWQPPTVITDDAWQAARDRFAASHARVHALLNDPNLPPPAKPQLDLRYLLMHDCYHVGQIMYIRSLQGLPPLET